MSSHPNGKFPYELVRKCLGHNFRPHGICPVPIEITKSQAKLNRCLRLLWEQHVYWTRLTIISIAFSLPDVNQVINRLLRNPKDFAEVLKHFYGEKIVSRFVDLFTAHLVIAAQLVRAAKAGNNKAVAEIEMKWYANADEIAAFLGSINPYWSEQEWKVMLHKHLALTTTEATDILSGRYEDSIAIFDQIEKQALEMADLMTRGIIKQFPKKFIKL